MCTLHLLERRTCLDTDDASSINCQTSTATKVCIRNTSSLIRATGKTGMVESMQSLEYGDPTMLVFDASSILYWSNTANNNASGPIVTTTCEWPVLRIRILPCDCQVAHLLAFGSSLTFLSNRSTDGKDFATCSSHMGVMTIMLGIYRQPAERRWILYFCFFQGPLTSSSG